MIASFQAKSFSWYKKFKSLLFLFLADVADRIMSNPKC